jgi:hypothetical protein
MSDERDVAQLGGVHISPIGRSDAAFRGPVGYRSSSSSSSSNVTPYFSARAAYSSSSVDVWVSVSAAEPEGFRPGLLQLARFFEATMTTLLHGRAPASSR